MNAVVSISIPDKRRLLVKDSKLIWSSTDYSSFKLSTVDHYGLYHLQYGNYYVSNLGKLQTEPYIWKICYVDPNVLLMGQKGRLCIDGIDLFTIKKYSIKDRLGIVHWGGDHRLTDKDYLVEGARAVLDIGIKHFKLYLGKKSDKTYHTNYNSKTLTDIARQPNYKKVFSMGFDTIVIVSSAIIKKHHYWKYTDDQILLDEETFQIQQLAIELSTYPKVKFIVTNWEGDCLINKDKNTETYTRMTRWIAARQKGVDNANTSNVFHGIEVNFVHQSLYGHRSVVTEVVPHVKTDYISYSCYDCNNKESFALCVDFIQKNAARPMIVGEFGSPVNVKSDEEISEYISGVLSTIEDKNIELALYWQIYDNEYDTNGDPKGFGLINPQGYATGVWGLFKFFM